MPDNADDTSAVCDLRLAPREWVLAIAVVALVLWLVPVIADQVDPVKLADDDRTPFALGKDYWTWSRRCRSACADADHIAVVGDSVVWGHYVGPKQTLSAYLNGEVSGARFVNLGIDGIHPAALAGLVEHYGQAIANRRVLLHANLLWMSSKRHDLREAKAFAFNHPELVSQFADRIPCYQANTSERLGVVISRELPFFGWARHVQLTLWDGQDLASWTLAHPYACPASPPGYRLPSPEDPPVPTPVARPWTQRSDILPLNSPWVELDESYQWRCFRRTVRLLQDRGNRVFVLVGPFNEHMLTKASLATYAARKAGVRAWLTASDIPCYVPDALPSEVYADASHPLAEGYRLLAEDLLRQASFRKTMGLPEETE